jgi:hypothetical protein
MRLLILFVLLTLQVATAWAATRTWDGKYDTENIELTMVYFVPADRRPLHDWRSVPRLAERILAG